DEGRVGAGEGDERQGGGGPPESRLPRDGAVEGATPHRHRRQTGHWVSNTGPQSHPGVPQHAGRRRWRRHLAPGAGPRRAIPPARLPLHRQPPGGRPG
ncbi:hypothetical protein ACJX0J_021695, partial [Zea mays]